MEQSSFDSSRRDIFRRLVSLTAAAGVSGLLLGKFVGPTYGANNVPPSGLATFDGPVGIGTTSPLDTFDVVGTYAGFWGTIVYVGYGPTPQTGPLILLEHNGNVGIIATSYWTGSFTPLTFQTSNLERMRISTAGNVGIGTTTPNGFLDVKGASSVPSSPLALFETTTGGAQLLIKEATAGFYWMIANGWDVLEDFEISSSPNSTNWSSNLLIQHATGNVGIGTTSPGNLLSLSSSNSDDTIPTLGSNGGKFGLFKNMQFGVIMGELSDGNVFMQVQRIDGTATAYNLLIQPSGGNVGIGTTSPAQMLSVAGDVGQSVVAANGLVKAAALVNGSTPAIIRSFNNLPGGSGPTVSQPSGPGTYDVNFGVNVAQRFFCATLLSSNSTDPGGASDGQVLVSTTDGNADAVFVRTNDSTGTSTNRSFYLMVM